MANAPASPLLPNEHAKNQTNESSTFSSNSNQLSPLTPDSLDSPVSNSDKDETSENKSHTDQGTCSSVPKDGNENIDDSSKCRSNTVFHLNSESVSSTTTSITQNTVNDGIEPNKCDKDIFRKKATPDKSVENGSHEKTSLKKSPSHSSSDKSSRRSGHSDDFDFETRSVVLNFLGLVPVKGLDSSSGSSSRESAGKSQHVRSQTSIESSKSGRHRFKTRTSGEWDGLPTLPGMTIHEKFKDKHDFSKGSLHEFGADDLVRPAGRQKSPYNDRKSPRRSMGAQIGSGLSGIERGIEIGDSRIESTDVHVEIEEDSETESLPQPSSITSIQYPEKEKYSDIKQAEVIVRPNTKKYMHDSVNSSVNVVHASNIEFGGELSVSPAYHDIKSHKQDELYMHSESQSNGRKDHPDASKTGLEAQVGDLKGNGVKTDESLEEDGDEFGEFEDEVDALIWVAQGPAQRPTSIELLKPAGDKATIPNRSPSKSPKSAPKNRKRDETKAEESTMKDHDHCAALFDAYKEDLSSKVSPNHRRSASDILRPASRQHSRGGNIAEGYQKDSTPSPTKGDSHTATTQHFAAFSPSNRRHTWSTKGANKTFDSERGSNDYPGRPEYTWQPSTFSQGSDMSAFSDDSLNRSIISVASSTFYNIHELDEETMSPLIEKHVLPPLVADLKVELEEQFHVLEASSSSHSVGRSMSPESHVAAYLGIIGDRVQEKYGPVLDQAFREVSSHPREEVGYEELSNVAENMTQGTEGFTKVALIMLLGKKITYDLISRGDHGISKLVDYTTKLVLDKTADFIVESGGWSSIKDIEDPAFSPALNIIGVESAETPSDTDPLNHDYSTFDGGAVGENGQSQMTESYNSDTTTLVGDDSSITENNSFYVENPSLERISSYATSRPSESDLNNGRSESPHGIESSTRVRSRHGSGNRQGNSIQSESDLNCGRFESLSRIDPISGVRSRHGSGNRQGSSSFIPFEEGVESEGHDKHRVLFQMSSYDMDINVFHRDNSDNGQDNRPLVEGTMDPISMDPSLANDIKMIRQLSKEITEEKERDKQRASYYDTISYLVAGGIIICVAIFILRRSKQG